ncbi:hypothetical protein M3B46_03095 [Sphingobacterium daejeonense]|uniref:HipA family kinase n=3 Tax=Sphingobacterium daejeonense TaxID=371142 RepID=UPI0021A777FB|nr:HipA family kinase [Sphingobacterium daejeonense]MCT1529965.1 hypothetical protein [Sphingobacterium daejeonense]
MELVNVIAVHDVIKLGGSTKPILVMAINEGGITCDYVIKFYKTEHEKTSFSTFKELIVNFLAIEFELRIPQIVLAKLSKKLINSSAKIVDQFKVSNRDLFGLNNSKVGFQFLKASTVGFNDEFEFGIIEYANIYAFDFFILNVDRGGHNYKPNLLVDNEGFIIIDHELSFGFLNQVNEMNDLDSESEIDEISFNIVKSAILEGNTKYLFSKHLFFHKLKKERDSKIFDEFIFFLSEFSISKLKRYIAHLNSLGINCPVDYLLVDYILFVQQNIDKFEESLYNSLINEPS